MGAHCDKLLVSAYQFGMFLGILGIPGVSQELFESDDTDIGGNSRQTFEDKKGSVFHDAQFHDHVVLN